MDQQKPIKEAFYVLQHTSFNIVIPKKRGEGHLKSCFGWHSHNKASSLFDDIKPEKAGDTCDIDGYLSINTHLRSWEKGYKKLISDIVAALKQCFPYVDKFTESNVFWDIVIGNIAKKTTPRKNKFNNSKK